MSSVRNNELKCLANICRSLHWWWYAYYGDIVRQQTISRTNVDTVLPSVMPYDISQGQWVHYNDITWRLKTLATQLFVQNLIQVNIKRNIIVLITNQWNHLGWHMTSPGDNEFITMTWRLKPLATQLFVQNLIQVNIKRNIIVLITNQWCHLGWHMTSPGDNEFRWLQWHQTMSQIIGNSSVCSTIFSG